MNLKERFSENCLQFTQDQKLIEKLWSEIEKNYSQKDRHYHNLEHLENMFSELDAIKDSISNYSKISFSVFYHDVIYDASSKSNEEKSAEFAKARLQQLNINETDISEIYQQILATKAHEGSDDKDLNYLLDADLSILGKDLETYIDYTKKIRKEYSIYPDLLYKPGRKKVLQHFLVMENIFKTDYFREKYEEQAKKNIEFEIGKSM
jgi:predicted metal-dependent HD superfamily phosphohydrolase